MDLLPIYRQACDDAAPSTWEGNENLLFADVWMHPNPLGHRLAAEALSTRPDILIVDSGLRGLLADEGHFPPGPGFEMYKLPRKEFEDFLAQHGEKLLEIQGSMAWEVLKCTGFNGSEASLGSPRKGKEHAKTNAMASSSVRYFGDTCGATNGKRASPVRGGTMEYADESIQFAHEFDTACYRCRY